MCNDDNKHKPPPDLFTPPADIEKQDNSRAMEEFSRERARMLRDLSALLKFSKGGIFHKNDLPDE